jgi:hypothetical protein
VIKKEASKGVSQARTAKKLLTDPRLINDMKIYKVMPTVPNENLVWDIMNEQIVESSDECYIRLYRQIDVPEWNTLFFNYYKMWLEDDSQIIYDVHSALNMSMIEALVKINENFEVKLYYWFDVDREKHPDYIWEKCPLSGKDLMELPKFYHRNNRKISREFPLIFPEP